MPPPATDTKYSLGSVLNHVLLHQTVIGIEALEQMAMAGEKPDVVVACAGGGSNFAGAPSRSRARPAPAGQADYRIIAVEPEAAPSLPAGRYRYDFGDTGQMAPIVKMHTLGHDFIPEPIHAGGLRYHGMSPLEPAQGAGSHRGPGRAPESHLPGGCAVRTLGGHTARSSRPTPSPPCGLAGEATRPAPAR